MGTLAATTWLKRRLRNSPTVCRITYWLSRPRRARGFTLLMYHQILDRPDPYSPYATDLSMFQAQLASLSRFGSVLSLDEIMDRIECGRRLPPRCIALTFDDGYRDMYTLAGPLLKRHNLPAILYVAVDAIERGFLWPDLLRHAIRTTREPRVELATLQDGETRTFELATLAGRVQAVSQLNKRLKGIQDSEMWCVLDELAWKLLGRSAHTVTIPGLMLSWDELRSLTRDGIEIGAHTMTHPILTRVSEQEAEHEITTSRWRLEEVLSVPVRHFAYPFGQPTDFSRGLRRLVQTAGFRSACTTIFGSNRPTDDWFTLKRIDGSQYSPS